jgi:uncharacterized membrane protein
VTPARVNRAWPATIALIALIAFAMVWAQSTLTVALTVALMALVAGGVLLVSGTTWITRVRRPIRIHSRVPRR